jgi:hypothetical protein
VVSDVVVDVSFDSLGGLCTVAFLEAADRRIGRHHLFKRSILLVGAGGGRRGSAAAALTPGRPARNLRLRRLRWLGGPGLHACFLSHIHTHTLTTPTHPHHRPAPAAQGVVLL